MEAKISALLDKIAEELRVADKVDTVKECRQKWFLISKNLEKVKKDINQTVDQQIKMLEQRRSELLSSISTIDKKSSVTYKNLDQLLASDKYIAETKERLKKKPNDAELKSLHAQAENLSALLTGLQTDLKDQAFFYRFTCEGGAQRHCHVGEIRSQKIFTPYCGRIDVKNVLDGNVMKEVFNDVARCPKTGNIYIAGDNLVRQYHSQNNASVQMFRTEVMAPFIAVNALGQILITDQVAHNVTVFDETGKIQFKFGSPGKEKGEFKLPKGIACDSENNIYVVDSGNSRLSIHKKDGTFIRNCGKGVLQTPLSVAVTANVIYTTDPPAHKVLAFDTTGKFIRCFGDDRSMPLSQPRGIAVDDNGDILVGTTSDQSRVEVFNKDGEHRASLCDPTKPFSSVGGIAFGLNSDIFVLDLLSNTVLHF